MAHAEVNVTVGAVLSGGFATGDYVVMVTTEQGLAAMGLPLPRDQKKRQQETLATGVCRLYFRQMIRVKKRKQR